MANDYLIQRQHPAADMVPRRAAGEHVQQPTRIKSFSRQNQNSHTRKILLPLLYLSLVALYFNNLLYRDVGSGLHVPKDTIIENVTHATAQVWNSPQSDPAVVRLEPRSLADVTIANAEVAWKRKVEYESYLKQREERREELEKKMEEAAYLAELIERGNGTVINVDVGNVEEHDAHDGNKIDELTLLRLSNSNNNSETVEGGTHKRRHNHTGRHTPPNPSSEQEGDVGFLSVLIMIAMCTVFRVFVSAIVSRTVGSAYESDDEADEGDAAPAAGRAGRRGLPSFAAGLGSAGREAARLRRRARALRAHRRFGRFVERLNAERESNGERRIGAGTLRGLIGSRDFDGNDYDRLSSFVEENGPAVGSIFSYIGATDAEINRCPSRPLEADDDLLDSRRESGEQQKTCAICLEPYQIGETVRTIPCFHTFHGACIDPWLAQRAECPVCKHSAIG